MKYNLDDTTPEAETILIELIRRAPFWKRAEKLLKLNEARRLLIRADLKRRYPNADEGEMKKRIAARLLPREDVIRVYNWDPEEKGY